MGVGRAIKVASAASAACLALLLSWVGTASAFQPTLTLAPTTHDFGVQTTASASAPFTFTLTNRCFEDIANPGTCLATHPFTPSVSVTGDFAIKNNNCTTPMPGDSVFGTTCTFDVVFTPTAEGSLSGMVDVGDPAGFGKGAVSGTGQGVLPEVVLWPPLPNPPGPALRKKCKKKHRAVAAKKRCRKRR